MTQIRYTLKSVILRRDRNSCKGCKRKSNLHIHHIIPVSEGGKDIPKNLITLCKNCHKQIHSDSIMTYVSESFEESIRRAERLWNIGKTLRVSIAEQTVDQQKQRK